MTLSPYDADPRQRKRMSRRILRGFSRQNLEAIRKASGLAVGDLARVSKVSVSVIHHWEAGTRSPQVDTLFQVMTALAAHYQANIAPSEHVPFGWADIANWGSMSALSTPEIAAVLQSLETPIEAVVPIPVDLRFPGDWRVMTGRTQPQLASDASIPTSTLQKIERAELMTLSSDNARALATALNVGVDVYLEAYERARLREPGTPA